MSHVGTHDGTLVALSVLTATVASYTALDLAGRIRVSTGFAKGAWLATAAVAMGGGIWAMHFVAMLAFQVPDLHVTYDTALTLFSLLLPILVTGFGFYIVSRTASGLWALVVSGLLMGLGIVGMHYMGMSAMQMAADLRHESLWVGISALIAIGASTIALWLAFRNVGFTQRLIAAVVMGLAVSGMHYAAMQGTVFSAHSPVDEAHAHASLDQTNLALGISATTFLILFLALVAAMFDRRFGQMAEREARALRESEERFRNFYNRTPLPLHILRENGVIDGVSDAWLELLGYSREEVEGRIITDFMTEDSVRKRSEVAWPTLLKAGEAKDVEYRFVAKDGRVLDVLLSGRVERDAGGRIKHILGGVVDVTARKRAEDALRQAQKIEAVGALTGSIAHDFNNLLAVVLGNLDLLRNRLPDDPKAKRLLDTAIQGAERGAVLTQRMLAFARRQDLKAEIVDVRELVTGIADLLQRSIGPMVQIETRFPLGLSAIHVDANQLELALLNLVVNARDAMPDGGVITIAARGETVTDGHKCGLPPGPYVCLSVRDTGEGMDDATLARAMEPFFTTKGVGKGTGLGLSMVHGLAAQSGGCLLLNSDRDRGTTAEIWLPAAHAIQTAEPSAQTGGLPVERTGSAPSPLTILAVDDDLLVLQNTVAMLEDLGHRVVEFSSAEEVLSYLDSGRPVDLVITDQAMPRMTGVQLAGRIKAQWPHLPIILATGYADLSPGADEGLTRLNKPFRQDALIRSLSESLVPVHESEKIIPFRPRQS
ncbi:MHYT domain-containing protein [Microvirga roseola]|uniref:MHYT domain-containing protein n=1 Tax=Microvirga roseola TaxID=2883126 RepID=UPI001E59876F|nr:MHYT domain-containing protein [Microvirga roseola]